MDTNTKLSHFGETVTRELWADGTHAIYVDGERIATTLDESDADNLWRAL